MAAIPISKGAFIYGFACQTRCTTIGRVPTPVVMAFTDTLHEELDNDNKYRLSNKITSQTPFLRCQ